MCGEMHQFFRTNIALGMDAKNRNPRKNRTLLADNHPGCKAAFSKRLFFSHLRR